jgi:hypothetical protein
MRVDEVNAYVVVHDGYVINIILWNGNTDESTGGVTFPSDWILFIAPDDGPTIFIGATATQNSDGSWTFGDYDSIPDPDIAAK